jgi:3-hydroxyacyl-CoA dehydrogenase
MKLVEVIKTEHTDPAVYETVKQFAVSIGKTVVSCGDTPGFIVNRLLIPYIVQVHSNIVTAVSVLYHKIYTALQAMSMLDRGDASMVDIDISMKLGTGHPMGPLELSDYIGLDTCFNILEGWIKEYPNERAFFIPTVLRERVVMGNLGRKSGKGFYKWDGDKCLHEEA